MSVLDWLPLVVVLVDVVVLALLLLVTRRLQGRGPLVRLHSRGVPVHAQRLAAGKPRACAAAQ